MAKTLKVIALTALVVGASVLTLNPGTGAAIAQALGAIGLTGVSAAMAGAIKVTDQYGAIRAILGEIPYPTPQIPIGAKTLRRRFWLARNTGKCMARVAPHGSLIVVDRDAILYPGDVIHIHQFDHDLGATKRYLGTRNGLLIFSAEDSPDELPVDPESVERLFKVVAITSGRLTALIGLCIYLGLERRCTDDVPPLVRVGVA